MTDAEFKDRLDELQRIEFREDYERALYELSTSCTVEQCGPLRDRVSDRKLWHSKPWRNPTDYDRSDLSWPEKLNRGVAKWIVSDGHSKDFRDDLCDLAWHYHNLLLSGLDADQVFRNTAQRCDPRVAKLICDFVNRKPVDKSMRAFHLYIEQTSEGPRAFRKP